MNQRNLVPGLLLIGIGAFLYLVQATDVGGEAIVLVIGAGLLVAYAFTRLYGFLVPGSIMTGLGLGILWVTQAADDGGAVLIGLGLGFAMIALADWVFKHTPVPWWPLIPGGILATIGVLVETGSRGRLADLTWIWPIVLIVVGAILVVVQLSRRSPPTQPGGPDQTA